MKRYLKSLARKILSDELEHLREMLGRRNRAIQSLEKECLGLYERGQDKTEMNIKLHRKLCDWADRPDNDELCILDDTLSIRRTDDDVRWKPHIPTYMRLRLARKDIFPPYQDDGYDK